MVDNRTLRINDALDVLHQPETRKFFAKDEEILFSGVVKKINKYRVSQKRILVITTKYLYNICLHGNIFFNLTRWIFPKTALRRKIDIKKISEITLSTHPNSEQFLVHVQGEYDYRYDCVGQRDKIVRSICNSYCEATNTETFTFYLNETDDLVNFHTTDDDFRGKINRKQTHGKLEVSRRSFNKGVDYVIKNRDILREAENGSFQTQSMQSVQSVQQMGLFEIPEVSLEQSAVSQITEKTDKSFIRGPIKSIDDIALTTSGVLPKTMVTNKLV